MKTEEAYLRVVLFGYVKPDYLSAYRIMGKISLIFEGLSRALAVKGAHDEYEKNDR